MTPASVVLPMFLQASVDNDFFYFHLEVTLAFCATALSWCICSLAEAYKVLPPTINSFRRMKKTVDDFNNIASVPIFLISGFSVLMFLFMLFYFMKTAMYNPWIIIRGDQYRVLMYCIVLTPLIILAVAANTLKKSFDAAVERTIEPHEKADAIPKWVTHFRVFACQNTPSVKAWMFSLGLGSLAVVIMTILSYLVIMNQFEGRTINVNITPCFSNNS